MWLLPTLRLSRTGKQCKGFWHLCLGYRQVKLGVKAASRKLRSVDSFDNCEEKCREVVLVLTGLHRPCLTRRLSWASILANGMTSHSEKHHSTLDAPLALGHRTRAIGCNAPVAGLLLRLSAASKFLAVSSVDSP